ncbi:hypothetical protein VP1G_05801 [Cytospora mali]|uniref:Uncharacterized protein n=1 Tax=Cytospora mali TaxID=578113 RepID=A0A194V3S0_CYTMA|nr:hypothetical protein VP1G_05801 [Valsa mali var. pyri (nom. inval.)]
MAPENHPFYAIWANESIREQLFVHLSKADICSVRLANSACCNIVTRRLFQRVHLSFTPNSFTKQSRVQALSRIGHHIEHLTFYLPHSEATFLPPLIHPQSGSELSYLYTPHTSMTSTLTRPKYGNSELGDILTQQYPPLFHASTNVPSFINAMKNITNMRHLTIKTPGQDARERYRRDIVDYALISLRIAIERTNGLTKLTKLSLSGVHPAAFLYLRYEGGPGFGCSPGAARRWRQIRKLSVSVEAWDFYGPSGPGLDQLKLIDDYLRHFSGTVEKLSFTWLGNKGPCPLALSEDPMFDTPRDNKKLFNEVTSPMSPLPPAPGVRRPIRFRKLKYLQVKNASMNEMQLRRLVESHKQTVKEFDFENVVLINNGNWDEALAPLMAPTESSKGGKARTDTWSRYSIGIGNEPPKTPPSPHGSFKTVAPRGSTITQEDEIEVKHPSPAVEAVGKDLMDEMEVLETFVGLSQTSSQSVHSPWEEQDEILFSLDSELGEELDHTITAATSLASITTEEGLSTKLKKKRVRRRIRKPWHPKREGEHSEEEESHQHQHQHPAQSRSQEELKEKSSLANFLQHTRSTSSTQSHKRERNLLIRRARQSSDPGPYTSCQMLDPNTYELQLPAVMGSDDETLKPEDSESKLSRPRTPSHPLPPVPLNISAPLPAEQLPVLLQPAVYNPQASTTSIPIMVQGSNVSIASGVSGTTACSASGNAHHHNNGNGHNVNDGLSAVQRNLEQEELQRKFAEDAEARATALQKARDAVLRKMGRHNAANAMNKVDEGPRLEEHPALQPMPGHGHNQQQQQQPQPQPQPQQQQQQQHRSGSSGGTQDNGNRVHLKIKELLATG